MRLIDLDDDRHCYVGNDGEYERWNIDTEAPTIEAVRVAQWIEDGYGNGEIVCSNCGEPCATFSNLKPRDRYCKWCGARMKGEEDE